jgi:predicted sulfurtransferase
MFLQQLMSSKGAQPKIYQLHGGIQRYLEQPDHALYYKGKNFVFDPRRTDPHHHKDNTVVGRCVVCHCPHDDYDNGQAPLEGSEARCVNCRILLLVCPACRFKVKCWGQDADADDDDSNNKPLLFCGGIKGPCLHKPPVRVIVNAASVAL